MSAYSVVRPVSPLKKTLCLGELSTIDAHSVALRSFSPRPLKCCDGAAVMVSSLPGRRWLCHQSSSVMRAAGTPQDSRWAPTPRAVTKGTSVLARARMVGRSRWS